MDDNTNTHPALSRALSACAALPSTHPLHRTARRIALSLWDSTGDTHGIAVALDANLRTAQRVLVAFGLRPRDTSKDSSKRKRKGKRR